ncbi:hypothetical protein, partial [Pseudomonas tolaasii]|uniref:hypothetical protein n=1 Tax=Pseudomonas tolaasii TaxID=29442 RepID=UPI001C431D68
LCVEFRRYGVLKVWLHHFTLAMRLSRHRAYEQNATEKSNCEIEMLHYCVLMDWVEAQYSH